MTNRESYVMPYLPATKNTKTKGEEKNHTLLNVPYKLRSSDVKDVIPGELYSHKMTS